VTLKIGVVFPHSQIGADAGAVRAYAQRLEELGFSHVLGYDPERLTDAPIDGLPRPITPQAAIAFHRTRLVWSGQACYGRAEALQASSSSSAT
jgi:hypothetical protein